MCGIFCLISPSTCHNLLEKFKLFEASISKRGPNSQGTELCKLDSCNILFASSVLWLQGAEVTSQPLKNEQSVFVYNGDVFGGSIPENVRSQIGDTKAIFDILNNTGDFSQVLNDIQGPYAFVFLQMSQNRVYFGRDIYGRRSLLIGKHADEIIITSVARRDTKFKFIEVPSIGTFSMDVGSKNLQIFPWRRKNRNFNMKLEEIESFLNTKINIFNPDREYEEINKFREPQQADLKLLKEIETYSNPKEIFETLLRDSSWLDKVIQLKTLLENAVKKRVSTQPQFCQNCFKQATCTHASTGILFSGGVDCAVLSLLADKFVDGDQSIDLINVSFDASTSYKSPDRITSFDTLEELQNLCPERTWNFVQVDVTKEELDVCRNKHIADLIYPLKSILDDSLGCALWFASRAATKEYTSACRILLVGMGADELFGGYTRHRAALQKRNWVGLHEVLEEDWQNLSHRNLARDDRVVSDHGRQLRTPYLDEDVVKFVRNLNSWEKTYPSDNLSRGIGEKILLRSFAYHLGLTNAATFKKRALQFGSRIANSKEKAHEVSLRL